MKRREKKKRETVSLVPPQCEKKEKLKRAGALQFHSMKRCREILVGPPASDIEISKTTMSKDVSCYLELIIMVTEINGSITGVHSFSTVSNDNNPVQSPTSTVIDQLKQNARVLCLSNFKL